MARIKKYAPEQKLSSFQTFLVDGNPNSDYFRITEFKDTFTGGKNGFLIEGSEYLKESTEIKIEILDVAGNPIYFEPGNGIPEYYEGISKLVAVYIYEDTPIGLGKITVLGELKEYDDNGVKRTIPNEWKGAYNVKWERTFQINKKIANEDRVRFYRRPQVVIDEINKPIFNNNSNVLTKSGSANGIPLVPIANTNLSNFSLPTSYRIVTSDDNFWTGSIEGQSITFGDINYSATIDEVISDTEIVVSPPYTQNNLVKPFTNKDYSVSFNYLEGVTDLATALTGSFAKIQITDMKTFVGDSARVKVFRRSQSNLTDYEFVQEIQLESNELLRDIETTSANDISYGTFTEDVLSQYWITSSNDLLVEFNRDFLYNSAKLNSTIGNYLITSQSFSVQSGVEYTLDFNVRKTANTSGDYIKVFLSGSLNGTAKSQTIVNIDSSNSLLQKTNFNENILADGFDTAKLYVEVEGVDWHINNVSLKASQETSFSPDEITFIQQVPKTLQTETFDYRFEFYDINNNYIPVLVEKTKTFDGGNLNLFNKSITITPNQLYFTFDSASNPSNALPPYTIVFDIETNVVTGSVNFTSGAYDEFGDYISASEYIGGQYPGLLKDLETGTPTLHVSDFTGSRDDLFVQYIRFTGEVEGVSDSVVISRVQDGKGGVNFEIRPYRGTIIKNKSDKDLEVQAIRIDGVNEIVLRDGLPQTGFSDAKLRILTSSVDPSTSDISSSYLLLSEATTWGVIQGVTAGTTGSGEIDYNAVFNRDSIDSELTLYLMDGHTSESILASLILTDLQDGLDGGYISFDAEQFGIKPRTERTFTPNIGRVSGSFYLRGTNENPISGTLDIFPSMSVDPETIEPTYYMFYVTNSFDRRVTIQVTDFDNNIIDSGVPGESGITYYEAIPTKQLTTTFTYTEDYTSSSISLDKTFFAVPDGNPGDDAILVKIDPNPIVLNADQRGRVFNYNKANTEVTVTQGVLPLIFTGSKKPGTFTTASIITTGIEFSTFDDVAGDASMSLSGFSNMNDLTASIEYVLEIHPFFTASFFTQSYFQPINKSLDGAAAINIELEPTIVSIVTEENGGAYDFTSANTSLKVKQGDEYLEYNSLEIPGTFTASFATTNISVGLVTSSKTETTENGLYDTLNFVSMSNMTNDSASIDYNITVRPFSITNGIVTGSQSIIRKQIFTKQKEGVKARSVSLDSTSQTVNFDGDGVVTAPLGSIFLTATPFNVTASQTYYQFFQDGFAYSTIDVDNTFEIGSGDATSPGNIATWKVEIRDGESSSPVVASAEVTITGIKSGANNYQVFLTNPSPSVGIEVDGTTDFTKTGTQIKAFKGTSELTHVTNYSSPTLDLVGDPIGVLGEFSASVWSTDSYITQPNYPVGNPATAGPISAWTLPQDNPSATIVYKVDIEDGRTTYFLSQSISTVFEGATGPGLVMRGEWTGSINYLFDLEAKRRDSVFREISGDVHYWATTEDLVDAGSPPYTYEPDYSGPPSEGDIDTNGWQYLGMQDFFVAAKLAIFEESFVKNTINVGIPPDGNPNANIAIVGGTDEPYIAIGQTGTQGYAQPGIWMGMSNDGGPLGTSGTMGLLSLKSTPTLGEYKSLEWDGVNLTIRGGIRQTAAGVIEGSLRGDWQDATEYYPNDMVQYLGESWSSNTVHTSDIAGGVTDGTPGTGPWTVAAGAGKTANLSATSFVIQYDEFGLNPTPASTITLIASSSNFVNGYFKFTGGGASFTDETTFTDGLSANTDTATLSVPASYFSTPLTLNVAVAEGDQIEKVSDSITITALKSGADSTPQYMITPLTGTQIKNSSGTIELQVQESSISGLSDVTSGWPQIYDGGSLIAVGSGVTDGGNGVTYNPILSATAITGTKVLTLKDSGANVLDSITLVDVSDGLGGGSFLSPNLKSTRNPGYGTYNPTFLSATASFFDTSGTEYTKQVRITPSLTGTTDYMAVGAASGDTEITITANDGDGGSITLGGSAVATKDVVLVATFTDPATSQTTTINETFYIVSDGADGLAAITVVNTNQSHTLPASSDGIVSSYTNSGTDISVYEGTGSLTYDGVGTSAGTWTVSTTVTPTSAITVGSVTDNGDDITIGNHSGMSNSEPIANITYTISGKRINGDSFTSATTQTITKAVAGVNSKSVRLSTDYQAFVVAKNGTISPSTITFTANRQNIASSTVFTSSPTVTLGGSGDTATLTSANFGVNTAVTVTATADSLSDEITVVKVVEGSDALTTILSNESHTFQADSVGTVSSYVGSGTNILIYEGATQLDYDGSGTTAGHWTVSATPTNITAGAISDGGNYATVADHSSMTANQASISYSISGKKLNGDSFSFTKTQSFSKSLSGQNGTNGSAGVNGTNGAAGTPSGIVYAGAWTLLLPDGSTPDTTDKVSYLAEDDLKYVTKYAAGGTNYWVCATTHRYTGTGGSGWDEDDITVEGGTYYICTNDTADPPSVDPPSWIDIGSSIEPGTWAGGWTAFGAEFTSVATDILFAQDVYADKTVNIGAKGGSPVISLNSDAGNSNANPHMSIGQGGTQGFGDNGIYFGYTGGNPVLSMVSGSTFFIYQSGSIELSDASFVGSGSIIEGSSIRVGRNLDVSVTASNAYNFTVSTEGVISASQAYVEGTIAASAGNIGNWVIDPIVNGNGGVLRDSDSEIIFEPNIPEIQIYSGSVQRVFIGSSPLTSIAAVNDTFTWSGGEPIITSTTITSNASDRNLVSTERYTGVSSTVAVTPGTYQFTDVDWPAITIVEPDAVYAGTQNYPNYTPSYAGQYHGGFTVIAQYPVYITSTLYLEVVDTNDGNAVIGSTILRSGTANGDFSFANGYVAAADGGFLSVTGDTEITLFDGSIKLAKDVSQSDISLAWDGVKNEFTIATISNVKSREVDKIFKVTAGGKEVKVSESHGFWIDGGDEIKVNDIVVGETKIYVRDGDTIKFSIVDGVEEIIGTTLVYTLSVPSFVNYLSNDIISHNYAGDIYWESQDLGLDVVGSSATLAAGLAQTANITISETTSAAALRFRLVVATRSGVSKSVNSSGIITDNWYQQTVDIAQTNTGGKEVYFASSPIDSDGISIVKSNNFVELKPAGFQLVTSENIYVKARRKDNLINTTAEDAELFRVEGGISYFTAAANPYTTAIAVSGHIRPNEAGWDLGGTTSVLKFQNLNGIDISGLAVSLQNSITTNTSPGTTTVSNYDSYVVLPGGAIIQWGTISDATNPKTVVFPLTFPNSVSSVVCSTVRNSGGNDGVNHVYNIRRSQCDLVLDGSGGMWIAIGH